MIRTSEASDNLFTGLMAIAILVLVCALGFLVFVKRPSMSDAKFVHTVAQGKLHDQLMLGKARLTKLASAAAPVIWTSSIDAVAPSALAKVTALAKTRQVKLGAFRPERTTQLNGLTEVPFLVSVDGTFPNTIAFIRDLEGSSSKLAVSQAQMSSSDGNSDRVTASVGIVAYVKLEKGNG